MPLTAEQYETLLRKSREPRWCICADPENCTSRLPDDLKRKCRAEGLRLLLPTVEAAKASVDEWPEWMKDGADEVAAKLKANLSR